jgi:hypothetical protein
VVEGTGGPDDAELEARRREGRELQKRLPAPRYPGSDPDSPRGRLGDAVGLGCCAADAIEAATVLVAVVALGVVGVRAWRVARN